MFAGQVGGYVMLSPNDRPRRGGRRDQSAEAELPAEQLKAVNSAEVAIVLNRPGRRPVLMELMQMLEAQATSGSQEMAPLLNTYFRIYRELLSQIDMVTLAGRFVEGGLVFEELVAFQPDTPYARPWRPRNSRARPTWRPAEPAVRHGDGRRVTTASRTSRWAWT